MHPSGTSRRSSDPTSVGIGGESALPLLLVPPAGSRSPGAHDILDPAAGLSARRRRLAALRGVAIGLLAAGLCAPLGLLLAAALFGYPSLG